MTDHTPADAIDTAPALLATEAPDVADQPVAAQSTPAGWIPTPDGTYRFWDGAAWTDLRWEGEATAPTVGASRNPRSHKKALTFGIIAAVLVALVCVGIVAKNASDAQATAVKSAEAETARVAAESEAKDAADAVAAAAKAEDDAERASRTLSVKAIEASVKTLAEKDVSTGVLDGPILSVSCSPIGAGSTNDLTQLTTVFECFAEHKKNADGSSNGYTFNANMNWSKGTYTYGLGKATS